MFKLLMNGLKALKAGESLKNMETWKNRQTAMNAVTVLIVFIVSFFPDTVKVTEEQATEISGAIVTIVGLVNVYFVNATSKKVGVK